VPKFHFDFDEFAKASLGEIGEVLVDGARENMNEVSNGRTYIINGKAHVASKEGDSANNLSGALNDTIRYKIDGTVLEFGAGNEDINYAKYLENPNILNRPNYTKTIVENESKIDKIIEKEFLENIRFR